MAEIPQNASRAPQPSQEEPRATLLSNILAIIGFIILIVVVIWGLVHLAGISSAWFSSLFGGSDNAIEVTAPESATSGTPFAVSWEYDEPTDGRYSFLYQCERGLELRTPGPAGSTNSIPCGAAFTIASVTESISVTPVLSGDTALDVPISILFVPTVSATTSGQVTPEAQGSAVVRIEPAETQTPTTPVPTTPTPTPPTSSNGSNPPGAPSTPSPSTPAPSPSTPTPSAPADLSLRIISVTADGYGNGTAVFDIGNVGGSASGPYYFTALLPTATGYRYTSPTQISLASGSHIQNTLRFSGASPGIFSVSVVKTDINPANNYASQRVVNTYSPYTPSYLPAGQAGGEMPYGPRNYAPYMQYPSVNYPYHYQEHAPYTTYYPYAQ